MTIERSYDLPVEQTQWVASDGRALFQWNYDEGREELLSLYERGKDQQWNATARIDWKRNLDPENPMELPDETINIYGSHVWNKMTAKERATLRRHIQAWQISQFLHGEQGALICSAKIVQQAPDIDAKFYAATQVMDEARHVEAYSRLLREKFELAYPIGRPLKVMLDNTIGDGRWDITYLGMQVLIEGLALAAFQSIRDRAKNSLAASVTAYVIQDEARHVAFGRLVLRDYYRQLTDAERAEREDFVIESCAHLRGRFGTGDVWDQVGLPKAECMEIAAGSTNLQQYHTRLFTRIVPVIRDIGLWSPKVRAALEKMGILNLASTDTNALLEEDARIAAKFDSGMLPGIA